MEMDEAAARDQLTRGCGRASRGGDRPQPLGYSRVPDSLYHGVHVRFLGNTWDADGSKTSCRGDGRRQAHGFVGPQAAVLHHRMSYSHQAREARHTMFSSM